MGQSMRKMMTTCYKGEDVRILMQGLDAAGKTTMLYKMKVGGLFGVTLGSLFLLLSLSHHTHTLSPSLPPFLPLSIRPSVQLGEVVTTIPTIGFNVETVNHKNVDLIVWDVGGRDKTRALWRHYYQNTSAVIFVVDSNDRERVESAKEELQRLTREDELKDVCVLILANKQDLPNAMSVKEITEQLELHTVLRGFPWSVYGSCATQGDGLYEGLDWLSAAIAEKKARRDITAADQAASKGDSRGSALAAALKHLKNYLLA